MLPQRTSLQNSRTSLLEYFPQSPCICMSTANDSNSRAATAVRHPSFYPTLVILANFAFSIGIIGILLGQVVTFVPGSEQAWFTLSGALVLAGLVLPRWPHRVAAVLLVALCVLAALQGHQRGEDHKTKLAARRENSNSR